MENPKCPYCGGEMELNYVGDWHWYGCPHCLSGSPRVKGKEAAYDAAMKRFRAKGEWIEEPVSGWPYCSECGYGALFKDIYETPIRSNFCPNCGADMREEADGDE